VAIDRDSTLAWMTAFAGEMSEHRQELVRLDTAIGDGDHGTNMNRGMQKALEKLSVAEPADAGAVLKTVAMTLISTVGGAAGPLYGTLFLQLGNALAGETEVDLASFGAAWRKGLEGVQSRGKAELGDKTMVDALGPAVEALERRRRSSRARDGPATWAIGAPIIRTRARHPPTTSSRAPPRR
jgi:dihydroxyacetone kinase-like protein